MPVIAINATIGPATPPPSNAPFTVALEVVGNSGITTDTAQFRAVVTGYAGGVPEEDLLYVYDYGNPGAVSPNLPIITALPHIRDMNSSIGSEGACMIEEAGDRTITCTVHDGINTPVSASVTLTTVDKLTHAWQDVFIVAPDEDYTGAPSFPNAVNVTNTTDLSDGLPHEVGDPGWSFSRSETHTLILIKRGHTYNSSNMSRLSNNFRLQKASQLESWGNEADPKPVIEFQMFGTGNDGRIFIKFNKLNFVGTYDETTETVGSNNTPGVRILGAANRSEPNYGYVQITNCDFSGSNVAIDCNGSPAHVTHCVTTNISNMHMFTWAEGALWGNRMERSVDAMGGDLKGGKNVNKNEHAAFRFEGIPFGRSVIMKNHAFNNAGWSGASGGPAHQPCWRLDTTSLGNVFCQVSQNYIEGGGRAITFEQASAGPTGAGSTYIIYGNYIKGTANAFADVFEGDKSGVLIKCNVIVIPNVPMEHAAGNPVEWVLAMKVFTKASDHDTRPPRLIGNTIIFDQVTPAPPILAGSIPGFVAVTTVEHDNILHVPNATSGAIDAGPFITTPVAFGRYKGKKWQFDPGKLYDPNETDPVEIARRYNSDAVDQPILDPTFSTEGYMFNLYVPDVGAPGYRSASANVPIEDFWGNLRGANPNQGAI